MISFVNNHKENLKKKTSQRCPPKLKDSNRLQSPDEKDYLSLIFYFVGVIGIFHISSWYKLESWVWVVGRGGG